MALVTGPDFVALQVRDLGASARFYEERLGWNGRPRAPRARWSSLPSPWRSR